MADGPIAIGVELIIQLNGSDGVKVPQNLFKEFCLEGITLSPSNISKSHL